MADLKQMHDLMVAMMPAGATHDEDTCTICQASAEHGDDMADQTFTEAEAKSLVDAAVSAAVKPLNDEIANLKGSQESAEVDAKIAEAVAEVQAKADELQTQLDAAVLQAGAISQERDDLVAYLESVATEEAAAAETARLREERIAKVAEVASFPEDYVKASADRWAGMEAEAFEALLEDYKAAGAKPAPKNDSIPTGTALQASREESGSTDAVKDVIRLRDRRIDPRRI